MILPPMSACGNCLGWPKVADPMIEAHYYTEYVAVYLRPYFPDLVSYSRFVELMPRPLVPLQIVRF